ncbi:MAG: hypothetical protein K5875_08095 [Saccharofermentans sp.]|nr:hypothetical protein [Saccharofermentans sp.]
MWYLILVALLYAVIGILFSTPGPFDSFAGNLSVNAFRVIWLTAAIGLWVWAERKKRIDSLSVEQPEN